MLISTREVAQAQEQLMRAVADLTDDDLRGDSRCAEWTRGHVLTHLARNGEGMANLARWAMDGEVVPMYPPGRRDADIADGANRPADEVRHDLEATNQLVLDALGELEGAVATDPMVAERVVRLGDPEQGPEVPARLLPFLRLQEVVVHHLDLDIGLRADQWREEYLDAGLAWVWPRIAARVDEPPTLRRLGGDGIGVLEPAGGTPEVTGSGADLLVWLLGRSGADERARLVVSPDGADLPELPDF